MCNSYVCEKYFDIFFNKRNKHRQFRSLQSFKRLQLRKMEVDAKEIVNKNRLILFHIIYNLML